MSVLLILQDPMHLMIPHNNYSTENFMLSCLPVALVVHARGHSNSCAPVQGVMRGSPR